MSLASAVAPMVPSWKSPAVRLLSRSRTALTRRTALASDMRRLLGGGAPNNTAGSTAFKPITPKAPGVRNPGAVKLTRGQLLINQRISQAAVRRINHVQAELASGIAGRQIVDGSLVRANLTPAVQINTR